MLNIDLRKARSFLDPSEIDRALKESKHAFNRVNKEARDQDQGLGWKNIAGRPDWSLIDKIEKTAESIRSNADVLVVCGIGGSYLGAKAVIDALSPYFGRDSFPEVIYAGHHLSGSYLEELMDYLERKKEDGSDKSIFLNVISKSGSTLETAVAFRVIRNWMHRRFEDATERIICTTSREGGILNEIIDKYGYQKFVIPGDVGGRFSVLTPVGLLPIAAAGFDIKSLMEGAQEQFQSLEKDPDIMLEYAAIRRLLYEKKGRELDLLTTFEPKLHSLARWLQQLYGESEGKEGKGVFPSTAAYSTDLHSLGQIVQDGVRNIMETFITVEEPLSELEVAEDDDSPDLHYLNNKSFSEINRSAHQGTLQAHFDGNVPVFDIALSKLNESALGHFIYFYELLTAVYVYTLDVNPFNQPGVERYKNNIYQLLGKDQLAGSNA